MRVFTLVLAAAAALFLPGMLRAAELADNDYVTKYFGTVAVFTTRTPPVSDTSYWADSLPPELSNWGYIAGVVNTRRMDKGVKPLLNPNDSLVTIGMDILNDNGSFSYQLEFSDMRPSEVAAVLELFGGTELLMPGATVSYKPLRRRYLYTSAGADGIARISLGGREVKLDLSGQGSDARGQIEAALREVFGTDIPYEMYLSTNKFFDGSTSADLTLTIDMDGGAAYMPADGMPQGE